MKYTLAIKFRCDAETERIYNSWCIVNLEHHQMYSFPLAAWWIPCIFVDRDDIEFADRIQPFEAAAAFLDSLDLGDGDMIESPFRDLLSDLAQISDPNIIEGEGHIIDDSKDPNHRD